MRLKYETASLLPLLYTVYGTRNRKQLGRKWRVLWRMAINSTTPVVVMNMSIILSMWMLFLLLWQVIYLRRFKQLQTVNLAGNPISQLEEYRTFVIAYLSNLEYLDYRLVDQATVSFSLCKTVWTRKRTSRPTLQLSGVTCGRTQPNRILTKKNFRKTTQIILHKKYPKTVSYHDYKTVSSGVCKKGQSLF